MKTGAKWVVMVPAPQTGGGGRKEQGDLQDLSAKAWGLSGLLPNRAAKELGASRPLLRGRVRSPLGSPAPVEFKIRG